MKLATLDLAEQPLLAQVNVLPVPPQLSEFAEIDLAGLAPVLLPQSVDRSPMVLDVPLAFAFVFTIRTRKDLVITCDPETRNTHV